MPEDFELEISKTEIGCYILAAFKTNHTIKHFLRQVQSENKENQEGINL